MWNLEDSSVLQFFNQSINLSVNLLISQSLIGLSDKKGSLGRIKAYSSMNYFGCDE